MFNAVVQVAAVQLQLGFTGTAAGTTAAPAAAYTAEPTYTYEGMDFPLTVPDNCLFLMGDNRNGSKDSRSTDIGCVDTRDILGTALWRILPFSKIGAVQ